MEHFYSNLRNKICTTYNIFVFRVLAFIQDGLFQMFYTAMADVFIMRLIYFPSVACVLLSHKQMTKPFYENIYCAILALVGNLMHFTIFLHVTFSEGEYYLIE